MGDTSMVSGRRASAGQMAIVLFYFFLGGTLASLIYLGPGNGALDGRVALLGTLAGLLCAGLWLWAFRLAARGEARRARRWKTGLILAPVLLVTAISAVSLAGMFSIGSFAPAGESRVQNFERLWRAVEQNYPYFEEKGVDWPALHAPYRARVEAAQDDAAYFAVIADLLAELKDGHTGLSAPVSYSTFGLLKEVEGQAVVDRLGPSAAAVGLQRGDVILEVDGLAVDQAIEKLPPHLRTSSTPWNQRAGAIQFLLAVPPDGELDVVWKGPDGERRSATIIPATSPAAPEEAEPVISARRLDSGVGVIRVRQFWGQGDLVAEFDAALNSMMDAPGIILDVRGNGGGDSVLSDQMAGRFLAQKFTYGVESYRNMLPARVLRMASPMSVSAREPQYTGPLVVLVDEQVFSSTEWMVAALADSGRARLVGSRTGGGSGNPIRFQLVGGGVARFSTGRFVRSNGALLEGVGIEPDVTVELTLEDFRNGRDPVLEMGEQLALARE